MLDAGVKNSGVPCAPPFPLKLSRPKLVLLRPFTYHCEGLFPWQERHSLIVTPCHRSHTEWTCRRLTGSEMLQVLDILASVTPFLSSSQVRTICSDIGFLPLKPLVPILDMLNSIMEGNSPRTETFGSLFASLAIQLTQSLPPTGELALEAPSPLVTASFPQHSNRKSKAVKSDDAEVPVELWNNRVPFPQPTCCLTVPQHAHFLDGLRVLALHWWKR
jgi:hypothetical protein